MSTTVARHGACACGLRPRRFASEWVKFRTVRSTYLVAARFSSAVPLLFTASRPAGSSTEGGSPGLPGDNDIVLDSLAGIWFGQIAAAVLAVLAITSEYSTGMIRTTFAAIPRRRTVLAAKAVVVSGVVLVVGLATSVACFQFGQWILRGNGFNYEGGYPAVTLADARSTPRRRRERRVSRPARGVLARNRRDPASHGRRRSPSCSRSSSRP